MIGWLLRPWRTGRLWPSLVHVVLDLPVGVVAFVPAAALVGITLGAAVVVPVAALALVLQDRLAEGGLGAVVLLVGVLLVGPVLARPVGDLLGAPLARRGVSGELARRNAVRNPRRTASTAAALLVGVGVVTLFTVFGASVSRSIEDAVERSFGGDLVLTPSGSGFGGAGIDIALVDRLEELPEVDAAAGMGFGPATIDGRQEGVGFADLAALSRVADLDVVQGDLAGVGDGELAVSQEHAEDHGYRVGDEVSVGFVDGSSAPLTVAVVFDARGIGGDVLVPRACGPPGPPRPPT